MGPELFRLMHFCASAHDDCGGCPPFCDAHNARILTDTLISIAQYAREAHLIVVDSGSAWDIRQIVHNTTHTATVHRLDHDDGQLGALRLIDQLGQKFHRLVFLQHSTPLRTCVPGMPAGCHVRPVVKESSMSNPFWQRHNLANEVLRAVGVRPPWNWTVFNHCAFEASAEGFHRMRSFGLWARTGFNGAPGVLTALDHLGAGLGARRSRTTRMKGGVNLEMHQALEALCGAAAGAANSWRRSICTPWLRSHAYYYGDKRHGRSFVKDGNCSS
mmetsp:Transcript_18496/g.47608  ORF Transcript_18496/g.47608 Transcript_18496/m.47608 type:complete len:273 (-) Transcript_18496:26-844(-)